MSDSSSEKSSFSWNFFYLLIEILRDQRIAESNAMNFAAFLAEFLVRIVSIQQKTDVQKVSLIDSTNWLTK